MNKEAIIALAESIGLNMLDKAVYPLVLAQYVSSPGISDENVVNNIEGSLKHTARQKVGFAVDILYPIIKPYMDAEITKEIAVYKASDLATQLSSAGIGTKAKATAANSEATE